MLPDVREKGLLGIDRLTREQACGTFGAVRVREPEPAAGSLGEGGVDEGEFRAHWLATATHLSLRSLVGSTNWP